MCLFVFEKTLPANSAGESTSTECDLFPPAENKKIWVRMNQLMNHSAAWKENKIDFVNKIHYTL